MNLLASKACGPSPFAAVYPDILTAFAVVQAYAKAYGYAFYKRDTRSTKIIYACDKAEQAESKAKTLAIHLQRQQKDTCSKKCGCKMQVALKRDYVSGQ